MNSTVRRLTVNQLSREIVFDSLGRQILVMHRDNDDDFSRKRDEELELDRIVNRFSLLSHFAAEIWDKVLRGTHVKGNTSYHRAFTGKDIVTTIHSLIWRELCMNHGAIPTDRRAALQIARSLQSQLMFYEVGWAGRMLQDDIDDVYVFVSDGDDDDTKANGLQEAPTGVMTMLTRCYSPTCNEGPDCYGNALKQLLSDMMEAPPIRELRSVIPPPQVRLSLPGSEIDRQTFIHTLIRAEEQYVNDLDLVDSTFIQPLRGANPPLIIPSDGLDNFITDVFHRILDIRACSRRLLEMLYLRRRGPMIGEIGDILFHMATREFSAAYPAYIRNYPLAERRLKHELANNPAFRLFIERYSRHISTRRGESMRLYLGHCLNRPVEHLSRYPALLQAIAETTIPGNPDVELLRQAILAFKEMQVVAQEQSTKGNVGGDLQKWHDHNSPEFSHDDNLKEQQQGQASKLQGHNVGNTNLVAALHPPRGLRYVSNVINGGPTSDICRQTLLHQGFSLSLEVADIDPESSLTRHWDAAITGRPTPVVAPAIQAISFITRLASVFQDIVQYKRLLRCRGSDAQKFLDLFQTLLDIPQLNASFRRSLVVATQRLSKRSGLYPACYSLEGIVVESRPIAAGGFADIYKGHFRSHTVCIKVIRLYQTSQEDNFLKQFANEAILWGQLSHPNLLPIYGLYQDISRLCFVSPWMENGDLTVFLERNPDVERVLLASDIAAGLSYLHTNVIVHGDLKAANILVTESKRACLADFGLSAVSDSKILKWTSHSSAASRGGSARWQAPELFDIENDDELHNTKASDIYAWSCVCYEIFTGRIPFFELPRDTAVMLRVQTGTRPSRPEASSVSWSSWGLTEALWSLMGDCWRQHPGDRPTVGDVIARLTPGLPKDHRPLDSDSNISPAEFRRSVGGQPEIPSVRDLEAMLSTAEDKLDSTIQQYDT
ncbi:hypothetical protein D9615_007439 [Tricholomella constricta]|uniref:Uncharacterized protein n=1 Tax=Tricholomella constricta TaxID=117010 RepID=A0A8H5GXW3_9AGAR|nr:hypothetical protein D9615_007439 [Tricholomella constricta]